MVGTSFRRLEPVQTIYTGHRKTKKKKPVSSTRVWMAAGTNVSCPLKFWPFVSCQLNLRPFVSCQLIGC